ncbi:hypothetical protein BH09MYX1_BH09MYX1_03340 [soil metagenome]
MGALEGSAHAEPPNVATGTVGKLFVAPPTTAATYRYTTRHPQNYFRAVLEGIGVLGMGFIEYLVSTKPASQPGISPAYDFSIFRDKLGGTAQSFDVNRFNTNFIGHPLGGTLYYLSARSNRLSWLGSFAWAFTGSLIWEYLGEITEKPSYNDMIVTPWAGFSNGEVMTQLGSFFARGKPNIANAILGAFFCAPRSAHDALDGLTPERSDTFDALGFPTDIWHRFELTLGASVTSQAASGAYPQRSYFDQRVRLDAEVINLPDYAGPGKHGRAFDDGNAANLHFDIASSEGQLVDATFSTRATLLGYYARDASLAARGRVHGDGVMAGYFVGFEYGVHDYDRDRRSPRDQVALVSLGGLAVDYNHQDGPFRLRAQFRAGADFAGVHSYAVEEYIRRYATESLPTVLRKEEYYFALGPSIVSSLELHLGPLEVGGELRVNDWHAILGLDDDQSKLTNDVPRSDRRVRFGASFALNLASEHLRIAVDGAHFIRSGSVGDVQSSRRESTLTASLGAVF